MALKDIAINLKVTGVDSTTSGMKTVESSAASMGRKVTEMNQSVGSSWASTGDSVNSSTGIIAQSLQQISGYAEAAAAAFTSWKIIEFAKDSIILAARYDTLGIVMKTIGENSGYTASQMEGFQLGLQKTGISAVESRQGLALMGQAQLDMAYSSKLARIAQDAAVVGNINSSEAFNRMVTGLATGQSILLHHLGLMTNFEAAYLKAAHAAGKTTLDLTDTEKAQIRMNEVIRAGIGIQGAYEAAMNTVGKQLTSLPRYIQDLMVKAGELGQGALFTGITTVTDSLKWLIRNFDDVSSAVSNMVTAGIIFATSRLIPFAEALTISANHSQALRINNVLNAEAMIASSVSTSAATAEELRRAEVLQAGIIAERESAIAKMQSVNADVALTTSGLALAEKDVAMATARTAAINANLALVASESALLEAKTTGSAQAITAIAAEETAVKSMEMTWHQYLSAHMSEYMRVYGGHTEAVQQMGREWQTFSLGVTKGTRVATSGIETVTAATIEATSATNTLTAAVELSAKDAAFAKELRAQEWADRNRLITAMSEQVAAENALTVARETATRATQSQIATTTDLALISKSAALAETQLAEAATADAIAKAGASAATSNLAIIQTEATFASRALAGASTALGTALSLVGGVYGAIAIAIGTVIYGIYKLMTATDELSKKQHEYEESLPFAKTTVALQEQKDLIDKLTKQAGMTPEQVTADNIKLENQKLLNKAIQDNIELEAKLAKIQNSMVVDWSFFGVQTEAMKIQKQIDDNNKRIAAGQATGAQQIAQDATQKALLAARHPAEPPKATEYKEDKYTKDVKRAAEQYHQYENALVADSLSVTKNARDIDLANLKLQHERMLLSDRDYLDQKAVIEAAAAQGIVDDLQSKYEAATAARNAAQAKITTKSGNLLGTADQVTTYYKNITEETKAWEALNKAKTAATIGGIDKVASDAAIAAQDTRMRQEMSIQELEARGNTLGAQQEKNLLRYADLWKKTGSQELVDRAREIDDINELNDLYVKQTALRNELASLTATNSAATASMVGINPATGSIDSIADQTAHDLAVQQDAHAERLRMIDQERQAAMDAYALSSKSALDYAKVLGIISAKEGALAIEQKDNANKTAAITTKSYRSQLAEVGNYADMSSQFITALAGAQDQSSHKGFESAKNYSLGAAFMSTAAAIIGQLSGPDAWTPVAWARSALAGALGLIQIAKIESTSFGGTGSVSVPSGGGIVGGGSSGGSGQVTGSSTGSSIKSLTVDLGLQGAIQENTQALHRLALGITEITQVLPDHGAYNLLSRTTYGASSGGTSSSSGVGSALGLASGALIGAGIGGAIVAGGAFTTAIAVAVAASLAGDAAVAVAAGSAAGSLAAGAALGSWAGPIGAAAGVAIASIASFGFGFGNSWQQRGSGLSLSSSGGDISGQNYTDYTKKGGWFTSDKHKTDYSALDSGTDQYISDSNQKIQAVVTTAAAALGVVTNYANAATVTMKIETDGRSIKDVNADINKFFGLTADSMASTIRDLSQYAIEVGDGTDAKMETSSETLLRLASSLQGVNDMLSLTNTGLISLGLAGGDAASRLSEAFGGTDKLVTANQTWNEAVYTSAQATAMKVATSQQLINNTLGGLVDKIPATAAGFAALRDGLDLNTDSGLAMFTMLTQLAPAIKDVTQQVADLVKAQTDLDQGAFTTILKLTGNNSAFSDLYTLQISQQSALADAVEKGLDVGQLQIAQQMEWADAVKTATKTISDAQAKLLDDSKTALTGALSLSQTILGTLRTLLGAAASPELAYSQAKSDFAAADASNVAARATALDTASKAYYASGMGYQQDRTDILAKLAAMSETAPNISDVDKQIALLTDIQKAISDGNTAMVAALGVTFNAAQIDMGTANNALTQAIAALQVTLNTPITAGTAKTAITAQITLLQSSLNSTVTGTAKDSISTAINLLQLSLNGTITAASAKSGIDLAYQVTQGALNGTISGTLAATTISAQYAITQGALNGTITAETATKALSTVYSAVQGSLNGTLTSATASTAIGAVYSAVQGSLNGKISSTDATAYIGQTYATVKSALDGAISGDTAASTIKSQYDIISQALGTGMSAALTSVSDALSAFAAELAKVNSAASGSLTGVLNGLGALSTYETAKTTYGTVMAGLTAQYRAGTISDSDYQNQATAALAPATQAYNAVTASGITAAAPAGITPSAADIIAHNAHTHYVTVIGTTIEYDANRYLSLGQVTSHGTILDKWKLQPGQAYANGTPNDGAIYQYGDGRIPAFAAGGNYSGGSALMGELGPELVDSSPGYVYRADETKALFAMARRGVASDNYGSSNDETTQELREQNRLLRELLVKTEALLVEARAGNRIEQAAFPRLIAAEESQADSMRTVASNGRRKGSE